MAKRKTLTRNHGILLQSTNYPECFPENPRDIYLVKGLGSPLNYLLTAQGSTNASTGTWKLCLVCEL